MEELHLYSQICARIEALHKAADFDTDNNIWFETDVTNDHDVTVLRRLKMKLIRKIISFSPAQRSHRSMFDLCS